MTKTWLITGSASGLGRSIAEAALADGDNVLAAARRPSELDDLVARHGSRISPFQLDVRDEAKAGEAVRTAIDTFGTLDVLVNNAGYGDMRPFEEISADDFKAMMDTVFYGVIHLTRAAIPVMREQRRGHIIQISSMGGRITFPGNSSYHAAKWAVSGFTEALALETAPFNVHVTALEPGSIRTNFVKRLNDSRRPLLADYEASMGALGAMLDEHRGHENSDPDRIAQIVLDLAKRDALPPHILIGSDAVELVSKAEAARAAEAATWRDVSIRADAVQVVPA